MRWKDLQMGQHDSLWRPCRATGKLQICNITALNPVFDVYQRSGGYSSSNCEKRLPRTRRIDIAFILSNINLLCRLQMVGFRFQMLFDRCRVLVIDNV